jgi:hypothetical protein
MKLKSINLLFLALVMVLSAACSKKASSSDSGRAIDVVPLTPPPADEDDVTVDEDDDSRIDDDEDDVPVDEDDSLDDPVISTNILFNNYADSIPTTKVCTNVLQGRSAATLKKFFRWDIQNLEGPVTVCIEKQNRAQNCLKGENYCDKYPSKQVRIRIEYEDDFRFWYYDSAKETNAAKVLSYLGGAGSSVVEILLQDGAGFLSVEGNKTSTGAYDVSLAFADRPSYTQARNYDIENSFDSSSASRRSATLWDMKTCASSANGTAKLSDGTDCTKRLVFHYSFFTDMNSDYDVLSSVDPDLWIKNQVTMARQYVKNQFPSQYSTYTGYTGGTFGRLLLNGL